MGVHDRRLSQVVKRCQDLPGYELFQYLDETGERRSIESADVNAYLREITGQDFTAKDFRTWAGTVLAACASVGWRPPERPAPHQPQRRSGHGVRRRAAATRQPSAASARPSGVLEAYLDGSLPRFRSATRTKSTARWAMVLGLLVPAREGRHDDAQTARPDRARRPRGQISRAAAPQNGFSRHSHGTSPFANAARHQADSQRAG